MLLGTGVRYALWLAVATSALLAGRCIEPPLAYGEERGLRVEYHPPLLSVQARGVTLAELVRAIGAKVGFAVVETGGGHPVLTVSVEDASLEAILQRLLRSENYTIVYREPQTSTGDDVIDRIVLAGPSRSADADAEDQRLGQDRREGLSRTQARAWAAPDPDDAGLQVEGLLHAQALSAVPSSVQQPLQNPTPVAGLAPRGELTTPGPSDLEETLAITTRQAQQHLKALVDALATSANSLRLSH